MPTSVKPRTTLLYAFLTWKLGNSGTTRLSATSENRSGGGRATIGRFEGEALNNVGVGFTLGFHINENLQLTTGYMATVNDDAPTDLRMDSFKVSLVFGWHPLIEGMNRLGGG